MYIQRAAKLRPRHRAKFDFRKDANQGLEILFDLFLCWATLGQYQVIFRALLHEQNRVATRSISAYVVKA